MTNVERIEDMLSRRLRAETKDAHVAAERSGIMRTLIRGTITQAAYVALLRNLADIYCALEGELDRCADIPALAAVDLTALRRLPRLRQDISALDVTPAAGHSPPQPATRQYVARLHELGERAPDLLLAHAYVRYMGDLSGGLMLKSILAKSLGLEEGVGTTFYDFPLIPDPEAFKREFRAALDATTTGLSSPDALVHEAQLGFALHARLFEELAQL